MKRYIMSAQLLLAFFMAIIFLASSSAATPLPQVHVVSLQRVFDNGEHNAFTDLIRFNGKYYLTFRYIGGPLLTKWDGRCVGGRKRGEDGSVTALYWLQDGRLSEFAELPSGGDNSYPGFLELGPDKALVSYYSSHEMDKNGITRTAIYLAELRIEGKKFK